MNISGGSIMNRKYILLPFILITVCIYLLYSVYQEVNKSTIAELHKEQKVHAKQSATALKVFFENYEAILSYLAGLPPVIKMDKAGEDLLLNFYQTHSKEIKALTRIDSKGKIIYTIPAFRDMIGKDISYQSHIKQLLKEHKPVLSDVFMAVQGFRAVAYYVPVFSGGIFTGGLAVLIPFDELSEKYVKDIKVRQHGFAWVASNSGNIIYYPVPAFIDKPVSEVIKNYPEKASAIKELLNGGDGDLNSKSIIFTDGQEMYIDFFSVKVTDKFWTIVVSTPAGEVSKTMRGFIIKWLSVFSLLLGLSIYFMYYTAKARTIIKEEGKRRKAEEALISSEKKFRTLVEVLPDGIILMDTDKKILTANPKANELFGYPASERTIFGKDFMSLIVPDERSRAEEAFNSVKSDGVKKNVEFTLKNTNGSTFPAEISMALISVKDGKKENFTAVIRDIKERKQYESAIIEARDKAEKSDRLKSEFLAQMSHEIRSPINSILSFTSLIKDELFDKVSEDLRISFSIIENAGKRIIRTIGLILNMSEIQTGSFEILLKKINLRKDIIEKIYLEYRQAAAEKGIELLESHSNTSDELYIFADEYTIGQIISNLVDNAIKYTDKGSVTIALSKNSEGEVIVEVKDTGIGISKEYIPNLFAPFSQEEQGYTRKYEGNGLGLALVKKYCDINNIKIEVESEKGCGSNFRIIIPEYLPKS